ncbi:MAG: phenylalanine--tRNA ligase subunit beta, partial [Acetanaerobacterium sp.]
LSRNYNNRNPHASMFEVGTIYVKNADPGKLPHESGVLCIGMYGGDADYFALKGAVEALMTAIGAQADYAAVTNAPTFHPGRCAEVLLGGKRAGLMGEVHPLVAQGYEIQTRCYLATIDMPALFAARYAEKVYTPLPKYPAVTRDIALICDEEIPVLTLEKEIKNAAGRILEKVELFDVYKGKQIEAGKKSIAFSLVLRSADATLTDEQADAAMKRILKAMAAMGAQLRA